MKDIAININKPNNLEDKPSKPIISVKNINKEYIVGGDPIRIIKNVNLDIHKGEFVMVHGPSGSGKSTLLHILNGWEEPTSGQIIIDDEDLYQRNEDERIKMCRGRLATIHQTSEWIKSLSVIENITIPYLLAGRRKGEALVRGEKLLELLGMEQFRNYNPMDLSVGQQQRISMLRALINNPSIIMADEPTGNLDTSSTQVFMDIFSQINNLLKRTIVMVTHNMDLLKYGSKVVIIIDGEITEVRKNKPVEDVGSGPADIQLNDILDLAQKKAVSIEGKNF